MKKQIATILLIFLLIASLLFTACNSDDGKTDGSDNGDTNIADNDNSNNNDGDNNNNNNNGGSGNNNTQQPQGTTITLFGQYTCTIHKDLKELGLGGEIDAMEPGVDFTKTYANINTGDALVMMVQYDDFADTPDEDLMPIDAVSAAETVAVETAGLDYSDLVYTKTAYGCKISYKTTLMPGEDEYNTMYFIRSNSGLAMCSFRESSAARPYGEAFAPK